MNKATCKILVLMMSLLMMLIGANLVDAQAPASSSTWNENFEGLGNVSVTGLINTTDGGYAIAGNINSAMAFLIKSNSNGAPEWSKTYEGLGFVQLQSILQTSDGGYALAGGTASNVITNGSDCFFWLVKTDTLGNIEWNGTYGKSTTSGAYSAIQANDDGYVMVGKIAGNITSTVGLMIKVNSSGSLEWEKIYAPPGTGWAYVTSVVQSSDKGYMLAGTANRPEQFAQDYWLIKTDTDGNVEWNQTYYPKDLGRAGHPIILNNLNGGYTISGYNGMLLGTRFWVINIDSNGSIIWDSIWPETLSQPLGQTSFIQTSDGGFIISGSSDNLNGFNGLQGYLFMCKLTSDGNVQWQTKYNTSTDQNSSLATVQTNDGNYVLAGVVTNTTGIKTVWFTKASSTGSITAQSSSQTVALQPATMVIELGNQSIGIQPKGQQDWYIWIIALGTVVGSIGVIVLIMNVRRQPIFNN